MMIQSKVRKKYITSGKEHKIYPNILDGFYTERPFQKVCTDTTIISHKGKKYDWNIYIDLFNLEIIAYDIIESRNGGDNGNHRRAAMMFIKEKEKRGYKDLETIVHSDQRSVYTSRAFNTLFDNTIKLSMSRIATPTDNPIIEAINGWIKDKLRLDYNFYKCDNPFKVINDYIGYFNHHRLAYKLKYKTQTQYRNELGYT